MKTLPSIEAVALALQSEPRSLEGDGYVRLQVHKNGQWTLRMGFSEYDMDYGGFWGGSSIDRRHSDTNAIAKDLLEQVREAIALDTDNTETP